MLELPRALIQPENAQLFYYAFTTFSFSLLALSTKIKRVLPRDKKSGPEPPGWRINLDRLARSIARKNRISLRAARTLVINEEIKDSRSDIAKFGAP